MCVDLECIPMVLDIRDLFILNVCEDSNVVYHSAFALPLIAQNLSSLNSDGM